MKPITARELLQLKDIELAKNQTGLNPYQKGILKGRKDLIDELVKMSINE